MKYILLIVVLFSLLLSGCFTSYHGPVSKTGAKDDLTGIHLQCSSWGTNKYLSFIEKNIYLLIDVDKSFWTKREKRYYTSSKYIHIDSGATGLLPKRINRKNLKWEIYLEELGKWKTSYKCKILDSEDDLKKAIAKDMKKKKERDKKDREGNKI